jgi:hypothetical protein
MSKSAAKSSDLSERVYRLLLKAYPLEFRREYGPHMTQVFRDCRRAELRSGNRLGHVILWVRTVLDLIQTVLKEQFESIGKENSVMSNLRRDAVALFGCIGIIALAILLLNYGRAHDVSSILIFGYALDAVVAAGTLGNLIVFLLAKTTRLNPLRTALWTFLIINAAPVVLLAVIGPRIEPQFRLMPILIGYSVSFVFWFSIHWIWSQTKSSTQPAT